MNKLKMALIALLLAMPLSALADEGMWLVHDINSALEKRMRDRGLMLSASEIYNAESPGAGLSDAIVSIGFRGTGSVISRAGLVMTSRTTAYSDIAKVSTPEHDYLVDGFWAQNRNHEIPLEGETACFLRKVIDVTAEVKALKKELGSRSKSFEPEKIRTMMEEKHAQDEPGLVARFSSFYSDEKCYISFYKIYDDVRLVAAPPASIASIGGEADNWNWPRHDCDFALLRIYENGFPVARESHLKISTTGYQPYSFTMVLGYPSSTGRYLSASHIDLDEKKILPAAETSIESRIDLIGKWMDTDPEIRLKYSGWHHDLCRKLSESKGTVASYKRLRSKDQKIIKERELQEWIDSDSLYKSMWGSIIPELRKEYSGISQVEKDRATCRGLLSECTLIGKYLLMAGEEKDLQKAREILIEGIRRTDPKVEKSLLEHTCREFYTHLDSYYYGKSQRKLQDRFGSDYSAMAKYLWDRSIVSSESKVKGLMEGDLRKDPLRIFLTDTPMKVFDMRKNQILKLGRLESLEREYSRALYWMRLRKGEPQYPDANSTMRLSYGVVAGYMPNDGTICRWYTSPSGILKRQDSDDCKFGIDDRERRLLRKQKWGKWGFTIGGNEDAMVVDFLSSSDIGRGSSGSPVLNGKGEIIGLAFDSNRESLASGAAYTDGYNMCISTDIRFVLWVLDKYAGMKRLIKELDLPD